MATTYFRRAVNWWEARNFVQSASFAISTLDLEPASNLRSGAYRKFDAGSKSRVEIAKLAL
uniref:Transposase n=1 Tax=Heterorhabditis bacteriophora TaxID=37862 RepID=A0A1I7XKG4_HETBA